MNLNEFTNAVAETSSQRMPVLFIGHGNPMNAVTNNIYRQQWIEIGRILPIPTAILCISAHWLTDGSFVTMAEKPRTIHDFGGFPEILYNQQYPAPGAQVYAGDTIRSVTYAGIREDYEWGLDHGAWSILLNMYPNADIPVFQLSVDYTKPVDFHYTLAKELFFLRNQGVLIIASGNVVHNLRHVKWHGDQTPYDWAIEFDDFVKKSIERNDAKALAAYRELGELAILAHPTNDHYLPLMYAMGLRDAADEPHFFNDSFDMASMSMRSVILSEDPLFAPGK
jgi:4,5-DOPA dioxygenase extradiol